MKFINALLFILFSIFLFIHLLFFIIVLGQEPEERQHERGQGLAK